jgi:pheromone shutdown protein TraB
MTPATRQFADSHPLLVAVALLGAPLWLVLAIIACGFASGEVRL